MRSRTIQKLSTFGPPISRLTPKAQTRLSGLVLDERAQRAPGITVKATPLGPLGMGLPRTETDAQGRFVFQGLRPGRTYVNAFREEAFYPDADFNFWDNEGVARFLRQNCAETALPGRSLPISAAALQCDVLLAESSRQC
jgi:hypothetical protein